MTFFSRSQLDSSLFLKAVFEAENDNGEGRQCIAMEERQRHCGPETKFNGQEGTL
jgi:hypothetical protein